MFDPPSRRHALRVVVLALVAIAQPQAVTFADAAGPTAASRQNRVHLASGRLAAPILHVKGNTLRWNVVAGARSYVFATRRDGAATRYHRVRRTMFTPRVMTGHTVRYGVRAAPHGAWSQTSITYPAAPPATGQAMQAVSLQAAPTPAPELTASAALGAAPALRVVGETLQWDRVADVQSYEVATTVSGTASTYQRVPGTEVTPPAVAGETVTYGVRTAVEGSRWAERSITYPARKKLPAPAPTPTPAPAPSPAPAPQSFSTGVVSGMWGDHTQPANDAATLGAKNVRVGVQIGTTTATLDAFINSYYLRGISVLRLAEFPGRVPSTSEALNVASWASRYGAGGPFWAGKANPTPVKWIEFGNETAYSYQFTDNSSGTYAQRAKDYAVRVREARTAMETSGTVGAGVGLLAQTDPNAAWVTGMFAAVPDLSRYVAGWTMHPYGPPDAVTAKMNASMGNLAAQGAAPSAAKPMFVTEYGIASDDGRPLNDNYGWPTNLTYAQAAADYLAVEEMMRQTFGATLRMVMIYSGRDLEEHGASTDREAYFGSLQRNNWGAVGTEKGAVTSAIRTIMGHNS